MQAGYQDMEKSFRQIGEISVSTCSTLKLPPYRDQLKSWFDINDDVANLDLKIHKVPYWQAILKEIATWAVAMVAVDAVDSSENSSRRNKKTFIAWVKCESKNTSWICNTNLRNQVPLEWRFYIFGGKTE